MKHGPGRHVPSLSRCQPTSTRCTDAPQVWQGGEAMAIIVERFMVVTVDSVASLGAIPTPAVAPVGPARGGPVDVGCEPVADWIARSLRAGGSACPAANRCPAATRCP